LAHSASEFAASPPKDAATGLREFTEVIKNLTATKTVNDPAKQIESEEHPPIDATEGVEIPADSAFSEERS
jgi:hypothetical protein